VPACDWLKQQINSDRSALSQAKPITFIYKIVCDPLNNFILQKWQGIFNFHVFFVNIDALWK
jgi:hypothetical protein